jgi:hypothetical protein
VAGAQPYLGPRTRSGDMMMDGVPDVRACNRGAAAQSQQEVHPGLGWPLAGSGSRPQASGDQWAGRTHNACQAAISFVVAVGAASAVSPSSRRV